MKSISRQEFAAMVNAFVSQLITIIKEKNGQEPSEIVPFVQPEELKQDFNSAVGELLKQYYKLEDTE
jgi:hypothetical protein